MDVQPGDYLGPLTIDEKAETSGLLKSAQAAEVIREPGEEKAEAMVRLRNLARSGRIHPAGSTSPRTARGSLLWGEDMIASAAIQATISAIGVSDRQFHDRVALRLNAWDLDDLDPDQGTPPQECRSPAAYLLGMLMDNPDTPPGFHLIVEWQQHVETGRRMVEAALTHADQGMVGRDFRRPENYAPVASLLLPLDPVLRRVAIRIRQVRAAARAN